MTTSLRPPGGRDPGGTRCRRRWAIGGTIVTIELDHEFLLTEEFNWDEPVSPAAQAAVANYGNDEDRLRLAAHDSVTGETLDALSLVPTIEVRYAVACNPAAPLETLARLTRDHARPVKSAANHTVDELPEDRRLIARSMVETPLQRLKSRHFGSRAA
jgi:hypothetical protein